jgi:hypothetical protein
MGKRTEKPAQRARCAGSHVQLILDYASRDAISGVVRGDALYEYYTEACHEEGITPLSPVKVLTALARRVDKVRPRIDGKQVTCYKLPKRRAK